MRSLFRTLSLIGLTGLLFSCQLDDETITPALANDALRVRVALTGSEGRVVDALNVLAGGDYVAAGVFPAASVRNGDATYLKAYIIERGISNPLPRAGGCYHLGPDLSTDQLPASKSASSFFLLYRPTSSAAVGCGESADAIESAISGQFQVLGTEPGEVSFFISGPFGPGGSMVDLFPQTFGDFIVTERDETSAATIGVAGTYLSFTITGGTVADPNRGTEFTVDQISGRVFFEFP